MNLTEIIIKKIKENGAISFRDFMEMALYYPDSGYYTSANNKIGANGDYYTSSSLTPVFGAMIGRQLEEMWRILGENEFTIVEYGAGNGALCHDILHYLEKYPEFYEKLNYCIIEKSPAMRERERKHLHEKVTWHDSIRELPGIMGCILSNELLDNFPVHRVVMEDELCEVFVGYENDFVEVLKPAFDALKEYMAQLNVVLPKGFRTEINLGAIKWLAEIAANLKNGYVMTIDYGYNSPELYCTNHSDGTLTCYNKHSINDDPYRYIGEQDITTHVNFSALRHWGSKYNLECCGYTNQADFLVALGIVEYLNKTIEKEPDNYINYKKAAFLKHTLLIDMGSKFKVLVQQKGLPVHELMGLWLSNRIHKEETASMLA